MRASTRAPDVGIGDLRQELLRSLVAPLGGVAGIGLPMVLVPFRSFVPRVALVAVVALLVALVAWLGGRAAGLLCSAMSAMSCDTFLTLPYGRLRPAGLELWTTAAAFAVMAVALGTLSSARARRR